LLKAQTHFAQVPLEVVLKIAQAEPQLETRPEAKKGTRRKVKTRTRKERASHAR